MKSIVLLVGILLLTVTYSTLAQDTTYVTDSAKTKTVYVKEKPADQEPHETVTGGEAAIKNTLGLGPRVGYYKSTSATDWQWYFGAQARLRLSPYFGVEGAADYRTQEHFVLGPDTAGAPQANISSVPVTVSAMLFVPIGFSFVPYALGGVGWYYTITSYTIHGTTGATTNDTQFGYHIGAGLEIPMSEHAAISADYRWLFLGSKFDPGVSSVSPDNSNGSAITAALMFYF